MKPELSTDLITSEWSADGAVVVCIDGSPLRPGEITWAAEFAHRHGLWMRIVFVAPSADLNTSHRRPACSWRPFRSPSRCRQIFGSGPI